MKYFHSVFLIIMLFFFASCEKNSDATLFVKAPSDSIRYVGRVKKSDDAVVVYWPGTTIQMRFKGKSLRAIMRDEYGKNYFNVIIDGDSLHYIKLDSVKRSYSLAANLSEGEHTVELIKRAEWDRGASWFYGAEVENGTLLSLPKQNRRVIEFFGASTTAGYAIEDNTGGDSPDSIFTNNYYSYGAITARKFNADAIFTVKSGIGLMVSWFPLIMTEMFTRLDPNDSTSRWDFNQIKPHVVVINILQNDMWIIDLPDHPSYRQRFGKKRPSPKQIVDAYQSFVSRIRSAYPDAYIICTLGSTDATKAGSPWPGYVSEAVRQLNDAKILTHFFPYVNKEGHPRIKDHQIMAESLIDVIEKNVTW